MVSGTRFSIIITCYNQCDFIRCAVDSALSQYYPEREIIVVDDGSCDRSTEILQKYGNSIQLVRFSKNRGAIEARNEGATRAEGEFLVFLDGDDLFMPWALNVYERIVAERKPKIMFSKLLTFEGDIPLVQDVPQNIDFLEYECLMAKDRSVFISASSFVIDRQAFWDAGGWSRGIFYMDGYDLAMKLGYSGHLIVISSPATGLYRIHAGNSIHTVPPFLQMAHHLMGKEKAGEYPGGRNSRSERYAWLGGVLFFWITRAWRVGLYASALRLAASGWLMILAAIVRRSIALIKGRHPIENIGLW